MNIRATLTGSVSDFKACAGRCKTAAEILNGKDGDVLFELYLRGAAEALYRICEMEYGADEDKFLSWVTTGYARLSGDSASDLWSEVCDG